MYFNHLGIKIIYIDIKTAGLVCLLPQLGGNKWEKKPSDRYIELTQHIVKNEIPSWRFVYHDYEQPRLLCRQKNTHDNVSYDFIIMDSVRVWLTTHPLCIGVMYLEVSLIEVIQCQLRTEGFTIIIYRRERKHLSFTVNYDSTILQQRQQYTPTVFFKVLESSFTGLKPG